MSIKRYTIDEMYALAASRGGSCGSTEMKNVTSKLKWRCRMGHEWTASISDILRGTWCGICYRDGIRKKTDESIKKIIELNGGKLLNGDRERRDSFVIVECKKGHVWRTTPGRLKRGGWCSSCCSGRYEEVCRAYFEQLLNHKFPRIRPKWLRNPKTDFPLELDGYCEELGLAFEHNGGQHYKNRGFGDISCEDYSLREKIKLTKCQEQGVILVIIPELVSKTPVSELRKIIKFELLKGNFSIPPDFDTKDINLKNLDSRDSFIYEISAVAEKRGGKLLSTEYLGIGEKLKWKCEKGHEWEANPYNVKNGSWCPICSNHIRKTIRDAHDLASMNRGRCLSEILTHTKDKLSWCCRLGHTWQASYNAVLKGTWCPVCAGTMRKTIQDAQQLASLKGGKCLSTTYKNSKTKLKWGCSKGHKWNATYNSIQFGTWCPEC